jgi:hypothetical protein
MKEYPLRYLLSICNQQQPQSARIALRNLPGNEQNRGLFRLLLEGFGRSSSVPPARHSLPHEQRRTEMGLVLKIVNGRVEEYENGAYRRSYGSCVEDADTDGNIVAIVTADGRIEEYRDGSCQRSYCSNARKVRISGGTLAVTFRDGRVAEFENGSCRRMY